MKSQSKVVGAMGFGLGPLASGPRATNIVGPAHPTQLASLT